MSSVSLRHLFKVYPGGVTAVNDFSLEIEDKEFIVLVGPSGCGKSTTLRMVAGLEEISQGELYIDGKLVNDVKPKDRDIAMVFQNYALYPHMTVFENLAFALKLHKAPKDQIAARVDEALRILDIEHLRNRKPKALSGGQRQRVALGRAIVRDPKVFLMDEPLSNLDAKLRVQMRTEITKLHKRLQTTFIYVTHDQTEAMTMGSRIVIMKDGRIQQVDTPQNNYDHPANKFVAGFIGSPPMNFFDARLESDRGAVFVCFGENRVAVPRSVVSRLKDEGAVGREVILGVRPESIDDDPAFVAAHPDAALDVHVDVTEQLGSETYLYFTVSGKADSAVARVSPRTKTKAGGHVRVALDTERLHFFDPKTEETLLSRE